jgi:hypothetical protein
VNDARAYAGMSWLHGASPPVLHLDLKPANLLVDEQWHAKVRTRRACVRRPRVLMARLTRRSVTLAWRVTSAPRSRAASARRYTWHLRCVCVMHDVRCDVTRVYVPQVLKGEAYDESADGMTPAPLARMCCLTMWLPALCHSVQLRHCGVGAAHHRAAVWRAVLGIHGCVVRCGSDTRCNVCAQISSMPSSIASSGHQRLLTCHRHCWHCCKNGA